jgi:hypothetical protein
LQKYGELKERLRKMRTAGRRVFTGNLVFKSFSNDGYLDRMTDYIGSQTGISLSL